MKKDEIYYAIAKIRARMMAGLPLSQEQVDEYNRLISGAKTKKNAKN